MLVRVRACGICGSDLLFYHGAFPAAPTVPPGHEFAGEIAEVGDGVSGWAVGDRVVIEPVRHCRECNFCRTGQYNLCPRRILFGTLAQGALAEYVAMPAYSLYHLPDDFVMGLFHLNAGGVQARPRRSLAARVEQAAGAASNSSRLSKSSLPAPST